MMNQLVEIDTLWLIKQLAIKTTLWSMEQLLE